jgi:hypothetical protein
MFGGSRNVWRKYMFDPNVFKVTKKKFLPLIVPTFKILSLPKIFENAVEIMCPWLLSSFIPPKTLEKMPLPDFLGGPARVGAVAVDSEFPYI